MTVSKELLIINKRGLHARASAKFVQTVDGYDAEVTVSKDGMTVGGTSIMGLMMLAASPGCSVLVTATGAQAQQVLDALDALIADRFGEGRQAEQRQAKNKQADHAHGESRRLGSGLEPPEKGYTLNSRPPPGNRAGSGGRCPASLIKSRAFADRPWRHRSNPEFSLQAWIYEQATLH